MNHNVSADNEETEVVDTQSKWRAVIRRALFAIVLGAVGSGLWDTLAKPGLGWVSHAILGATGFASSTLRNAPYTMAALDASPLPSLLLLQAFAYGALFFIIIVELQRRTRFRVGFGHMRGAFSDAETAAPRRRENLSPPLYSPVERPRCRTMGWSRNALTLIVVGMAVGGIVGTAIVNQAIFVRRIFLANLAICSAAVPNQERDELLAEFAAIQTKEDWEAVDARLRQLASRAGVKLRPERS